MSMQSNRIRALAILLPLCGCQTNAATPVAEHPIATEARISVIAEAGSEVVITKYDRDDQVDPYAPSVLRTDYDLGAMEPVEARAVGLSSDPATPLLRPPALEPPTPLGVAEPRPWTVQSGDSLLATLTRFAAREGYRVEKAEPYPVWRLTTDAAFHGDFEEALEWLIAGFHHTAPRPALTLHPNRVIRLDSE